MIQTVRSLQYIITFFQFFLLSIKHRVYNQIITLINQITGSLDNVNHIRETERALLKFNYSPQHS